MHVKSLCYGMFNLLLVEFSVYQEFHKLSVQLFFLQVILYMTHNSNYTTPPLVLYVILVYLLSDQMITRKSQQCWTNGEKQDV